MAREIKESSDAKVEVAKLVSDVFKSKKEVILQYIRVIVLFSIGIEILNSSDGRELLRWIMQLKYWSSVRK